MNPEFLIIHHSLTADNQVVDTMGIWNYHTKTLGWASIGYNYLVEGVRNSTDEKLMIIKGRFDNEDGAHCLGFNDCSLGICLIGNYDIAPPTQEQLLLLKKLCNSLMEIYGIKTENVLGHWETYEKRGLMPQKSCPGNLFSMRSFRSML